MNLGRLLAIVALLCTLTACATSSRFAAISSKNIDVSNLSLDKARSKGQVSGKDCQSVFLIFPTSGYPTIDEALDRALEPMGANILVDAVVDWYWYYIPYIFGQTCWTVEGEAYDTY